MSGGFFRGTSADQDTRFSNKQAKLLKSQKFPPELDQLVDMRKVQMEVIKPWIATRVTELLGFEDEVLINFIFGLLDAKDVDGKQIQIQLTGFMEKNTSKFMRELWGLLLSAQQNASGVPQQFLDAKAQEIITKKAESDRIVQEIQKKREKDAKEQQLLGQHKRTDQKPTTHDGEDSRGGESKHGTESRRRNFRKSGFDDHSPSHRKSPLASRSHSSSPPRKERSPAPPQSVSPVRRRHRSPRRSPPSAKRQSPYYPRRRSPSPSRRRRRSPSPYSRRRSPGLAPRRSPSPLSRRRRSPPPPRRRQRSPSPLPPPPPPPRRSSPQRKWSSSPDRNDSPSYRSRENLSRDAERLGRGSRSNHDVYKNSRDKERRLPDQHINGREKKVGPHLSPDGSPSPARSELPRGVANHDDSPGYKRHGNVSESLVRQTVKQPRCHDSSDESEEEERPTRSRGRDLTRKHMRSLSESPEEREYGTKRKEKDAFTPDDIGSPQQQQSGKQSTREAHHSPEVIKKDAHRRDHSGYETEEEPEYGPDPGPVKRRMKRSDDVSDSDEIEKREKRRHKKSRKHRKYSDESSESESLSDESGRRRRREEKRRLKKEEKRQRREEKHRRKQRRVSDAEVEKADMREGSEEEDEAEKRLENELRERALQSLRAKKTATR